MLKELYFVAEKDVVSHLLLDTSAITPYEQKQVTNWVKLIQESLLEQFGIYIQKKKREENSNLTDRVIITDSDVYNLLHAEWETHKQELFEGISNSRAHTTDEGGLIIFNNPNHIWKLFSIATQKALIKEFGSLKEAQKQATSISFLDFLTHEVIHRYQDESLPKAFLECGVRYYQRIIVQKLFGSYFSSDIDEARITFYASVISKLGNEVHNVFFGTADVEWKKLLTIHQLSEDIKNQLFPNGEGL